MAKKSAKDRINIEVNAGSMADIAFNLLIFFLVTTTIMEDKGVLVKLPPWSDEPPKTERLKTRNVYSVLVNADNQLLVRGQPADLDKLRENCKEFIMNPERRSDMAESPDRAIVSMKNDRGTKYAIYLEVYNEVKGAYNELRDEEGKKRFGKVYEFLNPDQKREIRKAIPLIISESEPSAYGEEN